MTFLSNMYGLVALVMLVLSQESFAARSFDTKSANRREQRKVPVDLFVMSRCPDAQKCEAVFSKVLGKVGDITDLKLSFIGDGHGQFVTCKHGPAECAGDIQQLCVQKYADSQYQVLDFVECMNDEAGAIGSPALAGDCLRESGIEDATAVTQIQACWGSGYEGYEGEGLLHESVGDSETKGITTSCTIFIDGTEACVIDDGVWSDDCVLPHHGKSVKWGFVDAICDAADKAGIDTPAACGDVDEADDA